MLLSLDEIRTLTVWGLMFEFRDNLYPRRSSFWRIQNRKVRRKISFLFSKMAEQQVEANKLRSVQVFGKKVPFCTNYRCYYSTIFY